MPPRVSVDQPPPPPTDLPGVLNVLSQASDPAQLAVALGVLLDLKNLPSEEQPANELLSKALHHRMLCHKDARVRNACVRVLGRLVGMPGIFQTKLLAEEQYAEGAWTCLMDFSYVYGAYKEAVEQLANAPPPEVKKGPASRANAPDPEAGLPGPHKLALDAALRTLALMEARGPRRVLEWLVNKDSTMTLLPLVQLLGHHSGRVQMRAAQLIRAFSIWGGVRQRLMQVGCVGALLREASKNLSGSVRLEMVQALHHLCSFSGTQHLDLLEPGDRVSMPAHDKPSTFQLEGRDGVQVLLTLMLSPENGHAKTTEEAIQESKSGGSGDALERGSMQSGVAPSAAGSAAPGAPGKQGKSSMSVFNGPPPLEFGKPQRSKPEDLQLAAARALLASCTFCAATTERLVQLGGLQSCLALLPAPPSPEPEAPSQGPGETAGKEEKDKDKDKDNKRGKGSAHSASAPPAPALAPIADVEEEDESALSAAHSAAAAQIKDLDWTTTLVSTAFEPPAAKALTVAAHAVVLRILAHLLTLPDVQETLHSHALEERAAAEARHVQAEEAAKLEAALKAEAANKEAQSAQQQQQQQQQGSPQQQQGGGGSDDKKKEKGGKKGEKGSEKGEKGEQSSGQLSAEQSSVSLLQQQQQQLGGGGGGVKGVPERVVRDRWGRRVDAETVKLLGTVHEVLLFSWAAALPPPPRPTSEGRRDKEGGKRGATMSNRGGRPMPEDMPFQEHMLPPFGPAIRAAALDCLVQLAKHSGYATLLASSSCVRSLVGRLGRSDEVLVQQQPSDNPIRTSSPLTKGRSKAKAPSPSPPSSAGARSNQQTSGNGQPPQDEGAEKEKQREKEKEREKQQGRDAKAASAPEPELVAPLASLLQLLIPYLITPAPQAESAPAPPPQKSRAPKVLLGNKQPSEPPQPGPSPRPMELGLTRPEAVHALKQISAAAHAASANGIVGVEHVRLAVASAVLMLPESDFMVSARPPLPSPPPTPPPQPLATSVFLWDALDRPRMTDGSVKLVHIA